MADPARRPGCLVAWAALVALVAFTAAAVAAPVRSTYGARLSADEPHYLMTAMAIAERGTLDVAYLHADERYRAFHEIRLSPQAALGPGGRMVVPHDPLLPALLALPWRLGGWHGARLALAVINAALGALLVWTAVRRLRVRPALSALVIGVACASAPLAAYGAQLYPELPAALAVTAVASSGLGPPRARTATGVVLGLTALPWLAVKYVPVAAALAGAIAWRWWRGGARRTVATCSAVLAVAGVAYVVAHLAWYGGVTPYAAGAFFQEHGGELSVVGTSPDYLARSRRLYGLLVDRSFGIATWQPLWLLAVPAVAGLLRRRPDGTGVLLLPLLAGWLTATFVALTMHGWWFPGRQVVVVLPLAALMVLRFAAGSRGRVVATVGVGMLGVLTWAWLVVEGRLGRLTMIVDFAATSNPWLRAWRFLLPDHLQGGTWPGLRDAVWVGGLAALAWWGWRNGRRPRPDVDAGAEATAVGRAGY